ncbi:MAG: Magnesium transporter MgtE [Chlamydiae bacterium]|nr:Magnesium transporter MgtE [Chlamydiota bacterium]
MKKSREIFGSSIEGHVKSVETVLRADSTIQEALETIRKKSYEERIRYFYVINDKNKLVGMLPTRKFLLTPSTTRVKDVMETNFIRINPAATIEHVMKLFVTHQLLALPVVDFHGVFRGMIDAQFCIEEAMDTASENAQQDIFQLVGISLEQTRKRSTWIGFRNRMPWLIFNLFGGLVCAIIIDYFESVLSAFLVLAFFIPLVLGLSESVSMQAMSLSAHSIQGDKFLFKRLFSKSLHEIKISMMLSLVCGVFVGLSALLFYSGYRAAFCIGISILISVVASALFGATFPIILHWLRLDPKVASGPIVLMAADILTSLVYLSLSTWLLLN